jgi:hypothetical protein
VDYNNSNYKIFIFQFLKRGETCRMTLMKTSDVRLLAIKSCALYKRRRFDCIAGGLEIVLLQLLHFIHFSHFFFRFRFFTFHTNEL